MLLQLIGTLLLVLLVRWFLNLVYRHWQYSHIPGPPRPSFFWGHTKEISRSISDGVEGEYFLSLVREFGDLVVIWLAGKPTVLVSECQAVKNLLTDQVTFVKWDPFNFITRRFNVTLHKIGYVNLCGYNSVLTSPGGPAWKRKRGLMSPAFKIQNLTHHLSRLYLLGKHLTEDVLKTAIADPNKRFDIHPLVRLAVLDAITFFGFSASDEEADYFRSNQNIIATLKERGQAKSVIDLLLKPHAQKLLFQCMENLKQSREEARRMLAKRSNYGSYGAVGDVLDCIITANLKDGSLDMEDAVDDFFVMFVGGSGTTMATLEWTLAELARNASVMEKLVAEVDKMWVGIDEATPGSEIGDVLKKMPYLDAVLKEILRLHPTFELFMPRMNAKTLEICGYQIPSGTKLLGSQYVMHRWDKYWDQPDVFKPDRFLSSPSPNPSTYLPFLMGPRQCIGKNFAILEMKCFLCELLKRVTLVKDPSTPDKIQSRKIAIVCFPQDNYYIVTPRGKC